MKGKEDAAVAAPSFLFLKRVVTSSAVVDSVLGIHQLAEEQVEAVHQLGHLFLGDVGMVPDEQADLRGRHVQKAALPDVRPRRGVEMALPFEDVEDDVVWVDGFPDHSRANLETFPSLRGVTT